MGKRHLLEKDQHRRALSACNNLQSIGERVDWDRFTPVLKEVFGPPNTSGCSRRSWDSLVIFRCLLLGVMNGLSDEPLQSMLLDRTSFKEFAGLATLDHVPDQETLEKYRNMLSESGRIDELVAVFREQVLSNGYRLQTGRIVNSSVV